MENRDYPLSNTPEPTYSKLTSKTAKDSASYKSGFNDAVEGRKRLFPSKSRVKGFREAEERGLRKKK
jgi:hypothetical protein